MTSGRTKAAAAEPGATRRNFLGFGLTPPNTGIDPTNAIAVGAAYFAGSKELRIDSSEEKKGAAPGALHIRAAYNRTSQEQEEPFAARVEGDTAGMQYRITREDGAYDSGLRKLSRRIEEDLPLREGAFNIFALRVGARNHRGSCSQTARFPARIN